MTVDWSIRTARSAAKRGDLRAQLYLAASLATGDGIQKDETEAARIYAAALAQGSGDAAFNLATMYQRGEGVRRSWRKAHSLYKKAEKLGSGDASVALGTLALLGNETTECNPVAALHHFAMAALNRDKRGLFLIAKTLKDHPEVDKPELILILLRASAAIGHKEAKKLLRSLEL